VTARADTLASPRHATLSFRTSTSVCALRMCLLFSSYHARHHTAAARSKPRAWSIGWSTLNEERKEKKRKEKKRKEKKRKEKKRKELRARVFFFFFFFFFFGRLKIGTSTLGSRYWAQRGLAETIGVCIRMPRRHGDLIRELHPREGEGIAPP
jgi:hypothetical protein